MGLASLYGDPCLLYVVISSMLADILLHARCPVLLHMVTIPKKQSNYYKDSGTAQKRLSFKSKT